MRNAPDEFELHAFIDGELDEAARRRVEDYLAANPSERERLAAYLRHKTLVRRCLEQAAGDGDPVKPATEELADRLARRLDRPRRRPSLGRIAAGLIIFVLGGLSYGLLDAYRDWRVPPVVEAATQAHQVFSHDPLRPVELPATSKNEMIAWFSQHLGSEVKIPDLSVVGLRFVGGRLLAGSVGPMAQLLYEDRERHRLSVYLSSDSSNSSSRVEVVKIASYSAGYWQDGELTYTIVAEMEGEELLEIASEMNGASAPALF